MSNWESYEKAAEHGPGAIAWKVFLFIVVVSIIVSVTGYSLGWFSETAAVVQNEFGPQAALKKYEWFKDASAQLDKKQADIAVYEARFKAMQESYKGVERAKWPREDREQYNLWQSEVAGVKASYNMLAADYNSQMAKFNWRFANAGSLPAGASQPLPREFKPYLNE